MTLFVIPLRPVPNQSVSFIMAEISYTARIVTRRGGLYLTLWRAGEYVLRNRALRAYAPVGYGLQLVDTEGLDDPSYAGLGSRWVLLARLESQ